ncbi:HAMP domain-containing sensor histidine kinase [Immundisolibacter sp.]|uniref:HAMP domain-containing sensor histidine kinase n=1 Tax=Immundisolibacter sp. TaxID=1934948 RepID=UPI00261C45FB|nr:HAMP domain-containing sensor histidine kinase [Immundisolibacter sp.]MDD3651249.1 HAMP domain-containing sensor histidine kinase [Immundisolibacter sp.]
MNARHASLRQRLVAALVVLTGAVSGLFALVTFVAIEEMEESVLARQLDGELRWWIERLQGSAQPQPWTLANDTRLYVVPDVPPGARPAFLHHQPVGWSEVFDGTDTYHVLRRDRDGRQYYLVSRATTLERRERRWFLVLSAGCALSVLTALLAGRLLADGVLEPVRRLARRVRSADPARAPRRLAAGFADDEIGELARVFEQRLRELHAFIASERLFTSDVSHELRTPAAIIAGAAETLLARAELLPRARNAVERIQVAALEMQDLIDAFLALGRATDQPAAPCSVNAVVRAELQRLQAAPGVAPAAVDLHEEADLTVACPRPLLTVALRNLLDNAARYAPDGAVRVTVTDRAVLVDDSGPGLDTAAIAAAFARHVRLTPDTAPGEGLGLSIVRRICERLRWQVQAQPLPQGGTRFALVFAPAPGAT